MARSDKCLSPKNVCFHLCLYPHSILPQSIIVLFISSGNSLNYHSGRKFSTYDRDYDDNPAENCTKKYKKVLVVIYLLCFSHLSGVYGDDNTAVNWIIKERDESLSFAQMMIRPTQNYWR